MSKPDFNEWVSDVEKLRGETLPPYVKALAVEKPFELTDHDWRLNNR